MGGGTRTVKDPSTRLNPEGQRQFNIGQRGLVEAFNKPQTQIDLPDFGDARRAFNQAPIGNLVGQSNRLFGFEGTGAAKQSLNQLSGFRGTEDAFRTLRSLEDFGRSEQGFVTDARNQVLNFDEGFESDFLPLLQDAAQGKFLTQAAGNPFIEDFIASSQRGAVDQFNDQVLPGILSTFAGTGGVGSSLRAGFTAQNARDLQRTLGDISTDINFNVYEQERQRQLQAQQAGLAFEDAGLERQLQARTTNLGAAQTTAGQLLAARQAAGGQATALSDQRGRALAAAAAGQVNLSGQAAQAQAAALQGLANAGNISVAQGQGLAGLTNATQQTRIANAQLEQQRIQQLLAFQRNAQVAGTDTTRRQIKPGLIN